MARKKSKLRQKLVTARSELKKGFTIPLKSKIKSRWNKISQIRKFGIFWFMFGKLNKTDKVRVLSRIDSAPKSTKRKTKRKATTRKAPKRKAKPKKKTKAQRKASAKKGARTRKRNARK